jgi:hypothetical protein
VSCARQWKRRIVFRRVGLTSSCLEPACSTGGRELPVRTVTPRASSLSHVLLQTACSPPPSVREATRVETETTRPAGHRQMKNRGGLLSVARRRGGGRTGTCGPCPPARRERPTEQRGHRLRSRGPRREWAPVDGRVDEVEAKLVVAVRDSLKLRGKGRTAVRRGVEKIDSSGTRLIVERAQPAEERSYPNAPGDPHLMIATLAVAEATEGSADHRGHTGLNRPPHRDRIVAECLHCKPQDVRAGRAGDRERVTSPAGRSLEIQHRELACDEVHRSAKRLERDFHHPVVEELDVLDLIVVERDEITRKQLAI